MTCIWLFIERKDIKTITIKKAFKTGCFKKFWCLKNHLNLNCKKWPYCGRRSKNLHKLSLLMCFDTSWRFSPRRRLNSVASQSRRDVAHKRGVHLHRSIWGLPRVQSKLNSKNNWDAIICLDQLWLHSRISLLTYQNTERKSKFYWIPAF